MLKLILAFVSVVVAVFLVAVAMQPAGYHIERDVVIAAPPAAVFARVNDPRAFQEFSPWAKLDPSAKVSFDGPPAGTGAAFHWAGNSEIGEGRMTIVESRPNDLVRFRLDFVRPMEATAEAAFRMMPQGDQTRVTWSMNGTNDFIGKAFGLFMDMDAMVGSQFEQGLADLKALVEKPAGS